MEEKLGTWQAYSLAKWERSERPRGRKMLYFEMPTVTYDRCKIIILMKYSSKVTTIMGYLFVIQKQDSR